MRNVYDAPELRPNLLGEPDMGGRRQEERRITLARASLQFGHDTMDCTIVDASGSGVQVHIDDHEIIACCVGQQVILAPLGGEQMAATIRWIRDRNIGLHFVTGTSAQVLPSLARRSERLLYPRPGRAQVSIPATLYAGVERFQGRIRNISAGGALIESRARFSFGQQIILETELVRPLGGYVRWQKGGKTGVMFSRILPVDSAKVIAERFDVHAVWLQEVVHCHEGAIDLSVAAEKDQRAWWRLV